MMETVRKTLNLLSKGRLDVIAFRMLDAMGIHNAFLPNPYALVIEPYDVCNLHCPTCPTGSGRKKEPHRKMTLDEFRGIIDQASGYVTQLALVNYGEPFLHGNILDMIAYARSNGMYVWTSTNGGFFTSKEYCLKVVESGLDRLTVAIDGADHKTHVRFRYGSKLDQIIQGVEMLTQAKKELGRKTPVIELQFILMRHNFHQRGEMETLARRLGVDAYSEKMVSIDLNEPDCQQLAGEFLPQDLSSSRYYRKSDGALSMRGEVPNGCRRVYESAVIDSDGAVVPCCYDWKREYVMGNVFQERLEDIWRNHRYMSFRKRILKNRNKIPMCSACPEGRINVYSKHTEGISARKKSTPKKENI